MNTFEKNIIKNKETPKGEYLSFDFNPTSLISKAIKIFDKMIFSVKYQLPWSQKDTKNKL